MSEAGVKPKIDAAQADRVRMPRHDLWIECDFKGAYSDLDQSTEADLIEELRSARWEDVIARRFAEQRPWLYRIITDRGRALFLDFLPLEDGGMFLDVGSGWGQVAVPLSRHGTVLCLDINLSRLEILRQIAIQEGATMHYACGNFRTFPLAENQFDLVVFNGSLEWIALGEAEQNIWDIQCTAMRRARGLLKSGGLAYVGIENSLGLKYILGAPDDHSGVPNLTFLDVAKARKLCEERGVGTLRAKTWSLAEYYSLFQGAGLEVVDVYGCFPDYKLIRQMIPIRDVNSFLMRTGTPCPEHSGSDGAPLPFGENMDDLYRLLAHNGIAHYFCPSYGFIVRKPE